MTRPPIINGKHPLADRGDDLYQTPPEAVRALLRAEKIPARVWEPACGPGAIVRVLRQAGHEVIATDLVDYGCPDSETRVDFLMERSAPAGVEAILTNPPYKYCAGKAPFVRHALALVPPTACRQCIATVGKVGRSRIIRPPSRGSIGIGLTAGRPSSSGSGGSRSRCAPVAASRSMRVAQMP